MYTLGPPFGETAVEPGTNLLVTGPPLVGKRRLALETLATGTRTGEGAIIVSTRDTATRMRESFATLFDDPDAPMVGLVDAVTEHIGRSGEGKWTKYVASPAEMSAIGVKFSEFIQSLYTDHERERNRILVDSLSTLLVYSNLQTVFRFLHVFTSRVENAGALGLYTLESTAHDDEARTTLTQLFDGTITVEKSGAATLTLPDGTTREAEL